MRPWCPRVFQVEPILWLQHAGGGWLATAMQIVSWLGLSPVYAAITIGLAYAVRMRPALALVFMLLACALVVDAAKHGFALPRPDQVDARVVGEGAVVADGGAPTFAAPLPAATVAPVRARGVTDFGFPSGHVASATVFGLGVGALFAWRGTTVAAALWIALMACSRMVLGRHFLADVLGGFAVGAAVLSIGLWLASRIERASLSRRRVMVSTVVVALAALALATFSSVPNPRMLGALAGVSLAVGSASRRPPTTEEILPSTRIARLLVALALYAAVGWISRVAFAAAGVGDVGLAIALAAALPAFAALGLPTRLGAGVRR